MESAPQETRRRDIVQSSEMNDRVVNRRPKSVSNVANIGFKRRIPSESLKPVASKFSIHYERSTSILSNPRKSPAMRKRYTCTLIISIERTEGEGEGVYIPWQCISSELS